MASNMSPPLSLLGGGTDDIDEIWPPYITEKTGGPTNDTLLVLDTTSDGGGTGIHTQRGFRGPQCDYQESVGAQPKSP